MRQHMIAGSGWKLMALLLCTEGRGNLRGAAIRVVVWCITMIARLPNIYNGCGADFFLARPMYALAVPIYRGDRQCLLCYDVATSPCSGWGSWCPRLATWF